MTMVVNNVAYRNGKRLGDVTIEDISEVIVEPGTFVWLGLHEPDEALLSQIKEEFCLHELAIEDAHKAHQRPKLEAYGGSLFIVLKTAHLDDGKAAYGETHLFLGSNFLVSVRHGASSSYRQVRERTELNPKMLATGPGFAAYAILDFVVDNFQPIAAQFERTFNALEEDIFRQQFDRLVIERLYGLKSDLLELRNTALPVSDICSQLMRFHEDIVPKEVRPYLRDVQDHVARLIGSLDNMREMLGTAMQVNLAMVGVGQNEVVKRLAGWAAILALPTVVFSLYGMNFEAMPELEWAYSYPLLLAVTAAGCVLLYRKLRRAGWI
jgi:magnesium transporter